MSKEVLSNLNGMKYDVPNLQLVSKLAKINDLKLFDKGEQALAYSSAISVILDLNLEDLEKVERVSLSQNTEDSDNNIDVSSDVSKYIQNQSTRIQLLVKDKHLDLIDSKKTEKISLKVTYHSLWEKIEVLLGSKTIDITDYSSF